VPDFVQTTTPAVVMPAGKTPQRARRPSVPDPEPDANTSHGSSVSPDSGVGSGKGGRVSVGSEETGRDGVALSPTHGRPSSNDDESERAPSVASSTTTRGELSTTPTGRRRSLSSKNSSPTQRLDSEGASEWRCGTCHAACRTFDDAVACGRKHVADERNSENGGVSVDDFLFFEEATMQPQHLASPAPPVRVASRIATTSRRATVLGDSDDEDDVDDDDNGNTFGSDAHAHAVRGPARSSDTVNRLKRPLPDDDDDDGGFSGGIASAAAKAASSEKRIRLVEAPDAMDLMDEVFRGTERKDMMPLDTRDHDLPVADARTVGADSVAPSSAAQASAAGMGEDNGGDDDDDSSEGSVEIMMIDDSDDDDDE
jgi:hypothetical protein